MKPTILFVVLAFVFAVQSHAAPLVVGDQAPPLKIDKWVKNGPVNLADGKGKTIYVIEFWATWCPPCRMSIPHLSKLQKEYADKGVVVVGITKEDVGKVETFVSEQSDMDYNVGVDVAGETYGAYMSGVRGIPHAYIVGKDGKILWSGHPLEMDEVLRQVIDGNYNPEAGKALGELKRKIQQALQSRDMETATKAADEILQIDPEDQMALGIRMFVFQQKQDWSGAGVYLDKLIAAHPDKNKLWLMRLEVARKSGDMEGVKSLVSKYIEVFKSAPEKLNTIAWRLLESRPFGSAPLALALKASKLSVAGAAVKDTSQKAAFLDTLARCYYSVGRLDKAIATQETALKLMEGKKDAVQFERTLNFYRQALELSKEQ
jgi:thiol-disulfide isomerase/thioredoxin